MANTKKQDVRLQNSVHIPHAAPEVFGLPELLEMILVQSEMRDLLLWQRVNSTLQNAIVRNGAIQEDLFL
ncbi:hypothetical protein B0A48_00649 [Cryoendolithus antarcticus]|uniref:F-box domain-containing protein n=1 Tax=Cryoendolithus antarcticus TaxID=1507870 RepID=A0A1V8TVA4_9PEZI|nr:hypothetical protein B0A48_00649 [Cryoendolithus antarcticus]